MTPDLPAIARKNLQIRLHIHFQPSSQLPEKYMLHGIPAVVTAHHSGRHHHSYPQATRTWSLRSCNFEESPLPVDWKTFRTLPGRLASAAGCWRSLDSIVASNRQQPCLSRHHHILPVKAKYISFTFFSFFSSKMAFSKTSVGSHLGIST